MDNLQRELQYASLMTARAFAGVSCQRELILPIIAALAEREREGGGEGEARLESHSS